MKCQMIGEGHLFALSTHSQHNCLQGDKIQNKSFVAFKMKGDFVNHIINVLGQGMPKSGSKLLAILSKP